MGFQLVPVPGGSPLPVPSTWDVEFGAEHRDAFLGFLHSVSCPTVTFRGLRPRFWERWALCPDSVAWVQQGQVGRRDFLVELPQEVLRSKA